MVGWLSGRKRLLGEQVGSQGPPGFESQPHRQLEKEVTGSPSARARQPILGAKLNFLSLFCKAKRQKRAFLN